MIHTKLILCGFDLALAHPLHYKRLVQLASTIKFVRTASQSLIVPTPEIRAKNGEEVKEEHLAQIEPLPEPSNDKEVSTEAHSFITIPLKTYHEPPVSSFQCLEEPSYVEIFKESHTEDHKSGNRVPKWIPWNKVNYIRWRNILLEGYLILKKKGWKDWLDTHMSGEGAVFFLFFFLIFSHCILFFIYLCIFFLLFYFLSFDF